MEKVIILKVRTKEIKYGNRPSITEVQVKNGNRIEAKIYPPNKYRKGNEFQVEKAGIVIYFSTLEDALEHIRNTYEERLNAFALSGLVKYKVNLEKLK